jgi:hypothetical protein
MASFLEYVLLSGRYDWLTFLIGVRRLILRGNETNALHTKTFLHMTGRLVGSAAVACGSNFYVRGRSGGAVAVHHGLKQSIRDP